MLVTCIIAGVIKFAVIQNTPEKNHFLNGGTMKLYLMSQQTETPLSMEQLKATSAGIFLFKKGVFIVFDENVICNPY